VNEMDCAPFDFNKITSENNNKFLIKLLEALEIKSFEVKTCISLKEIPKLISILKIVFLIFFFY